MFITKEEFLFKLSIYKSINLFHQSFIENMEEDGLGSGHNFSIELMREGLYDIRCSNFLKSSGGVKKKPLSSRTGASLINLLN